MSPSQVEEYVKPLLNITVLELESILGFGLGRLEKQLEIKVEAINSKDPHKFGMDDITFMVSTNPGQPLRPITKVASGGELSRLSLAIQIISSKDNNAPTMIFDEVDAGIGGSVAEIVGKLLNTLAANSQIFCVTHLPQVASCGNQHLQVTKNTKAVSYTHLTLPTKA